MDYEALFRNIGMFLCLSASIYMLVRGSRKIGILFLLSFLLQFQAAFYIEYIGHPEGAGECWATVQDYYECLPLPFKVSVHLAQFGVYLMALSVFLAGKSINQHAYNT